MALRSLGKAENNRRQQKDVVVSIAFEIGKRIIFKGFGAERAGCLIAVLLQVTFTEMDT